MGVMGGFGGEYMGVEGGKDKGKSQNSIKTF